MHEATVVLNKLRPGDIILTGGGKGRGKLIERFTGGDYSHAAIMLTNTVVFDAVGGGLGFTAVQPRAVQGEGEGMTLYGSFPHASRVLCLRHHAITAHGHFVEKLLPVLLPFWGLQYPTLDALLDAVGMLRKHPRILAGTRAFVCSLQKDKKYSGPFCSQLVAEVFAHLGLPLFDSTPSTHLSPADLARSDVLEAVQCTCDLPSTARLEDPAIEDYDYLRRRSSLTKDIRELTTGVHVELAEAGEGWNRKQSLLESVVGKGKGYPMDHDERNHIRRALIYAFNLPKLLLFCHVEWNGWQKLIPEYPKMVLFEEEVELLKQDAERMNGEQS